MIHDGDEDEDGEVDGEVDGGGVDIDVEEGHFQGGCHLSDEYTINDTSHQLQINSFDTSLIYLLPCFFVKYVVSLPPPQLAK